MGYGLYQELTKPYPVVSNYVATYEQNEVLKSGFEPVYDARRFLLDLPKAPPTPDQLISADSGLPSIDVAKELPLLQSNHSQLELICPGNG